jgi:hypothetical protein
VRARVTGKTCQLRLKPANNVADDRIETSSRACRRFVIAFPNTNLAVVHYLLSLAEERKRSISDFTSCFPTVVAVPVIGRITITP